MKCKKVLAVAGAVTCLTVGGIVSQASSYVEGNMPGFPEMSCTGSIGFYNSIMKATTNCNKTPGIRNNLGRKVEERRYYISKTDSKRN